eukprot:TRINITY_DN16200_c0_g1_i1.p1 TRINITY_DN16200_c0_g1~~TRINITY_DN16200_c0_g1_i1.p1  ORF type:complete len:309 (+),score=61.84 TRINITY_DN16200_c0_g1_i1:97-1023(+)
MSHRSFSAFKFNSTLGAWERAENGADIPIINSKPIRIASHNVLKPVSWLMEWVVRTPERYAKEIEILRNLDADVIGLNEVAIQFVSLLLEQPWVREHYYVSDVPNDQGTDTLNCCTVNNVNLFGNFLLSRLCPSKIVSHALGDNPNRDVLAAVFPMLDMTLCLAHTTAYENLFMRRKTQMRQIQSFLANTEVFETPTQTQVLMGDLNLHRPEEDVIIGEVGFEDLWRPTDDDPHGYTWDTLTNTLIRYFLFLDRRRMRLDRILLRQGSAWSSITPSGVAKFATEPVHEGSYLFPSDHYGLYADLVRKD